MKLNADKGIAQGYRLSKNDTAILKAVFIAFIVLHNFFHVFPNWNIENEFDFKEERFTFFTDTINWNPFHFIPLLLAYLGHYGVQIFIFLSAYGLYISTRNKPIQYGSFLRDRIWKLYPAFLLAVVMLIVLTVATRPNLDLSGFLLDCLLRLSLLSNFFPHHSFEPTGPWWFYSMIVQFYLLFPFLRMLVNRYGMTPLVLLSAAAIGLEMAFNDALIEKGWFIKTTVIGHLPLIAMGMYFGKKGRIDIPAAIFLLAAAVFAVGNFAKPVWYLSQPAITLVILFIYTRTKQYFTALRETFFARAVYFVSALSMYLFAVNGFLRHPFVIRVQAAGSMPMKILVVTGFLLFVTLVAMILRFAEKKFLQLTGSRNKNVPAVVHAKHKGNLEVSGKEEATI